MKKNNKTVEPALEELKDKGIEMSDKKSEKTYKKNQKSKNSNSTEKHEKSNKSKKKKKKKPYKIYCTGDMHGDLSRFKDKKIKKLKKNDILIVCGDFGFIWNGSKKEKRILKRLGKMKFNILFVDGCHENYELLYSYETEEYMGGLCRVISGNLRNLVRGSYFDFDGISIFVFGGGQTADEDWRISMGTVWKQELPTTEEIQIGIKTLAEHNNIVDYIITHEPPSQIRSFIGEGINDIVHRNQLNASFDTISEDVAFKRWFFGKCHKNKIVSSKYRALFNDVIILDGK